MDYKQTTFPQPCKHENGFYTIIPKRWSFKNIDVFCCSDCWRMIEIKKLKKDSN